MLERLIKRALMALADILNSKFHDNFDMTASAEDLYSQGVTMISSGFVFPSGPDHAVGVYIVKYKPNIEDNKYGRYN
jgi:hypothetical protein